MRVLVPTWRIRSPPVIRAAGIPVAAAPLLTIRSEGARAVKSDTNAFGPFGPEYGVFADPISAGTATVAVARNSAGVDAAMASTTAPARTGGRMRNHRRCRSGATYSLISMSALPLCEVYGRA